MKQKIVITGASGFVGSNLASYLSQKDKIIQKLSLRGNWEKELDTNAEVIIHLAGKAHDTKNTSEASDYFKINTDLTKALFDVFLRSTAKDFIYFSSVKAVADEVDGVLFEENSPNPKTPYGLSKLEAEQYILGQRWPEGKRVFIIRPCMIHGPGNKGNLNLLYKVVKRGIPYPLASFNNERSFLSIENLNFMIVRMLEIKDVASGIYNFCDDEIISTNELVGIMSRVIGKKERLIKIPKWQINLMAKFGDIINLPLNSEKLKKLTENYRVSNKKIKKALNIESLAITAEEGLVITIKSFLL